MRTARTLTIKAGGGACPGCLPRGGCLPEGCLPRGGACPGVPAQRVPVRRVCCGTTPLSPAREQNHRHLYKYNLPATSFAGGNKSKKCGCYHPVKCSISRSEHPTNKGVVQSWYFVFAQMWWASRLSRCDCIVFQNEAFSRDFQTSAQSWNTISPFWRVGWCGGYAFGKNGDIKSST